MTFLQEELDVKPKLLAIRTSWIFPSKRPCRRRSARPAEPAPSAAAPSAAAPRRPAVQAATCPLHGDLTLRTETSKQFSPLGRRNGRPEPELSPSKQGGRRRKIIHFKLITTQPSPGASRDGCVNCVKNHAEKASAREGADRSILRAPFAPICGSIYSGCSEVGIVDAGHVNKRSGRVIADSRCQHGRYPRCCGPGRGRHERFCQATPVPDTRCGSRPRKTTEQWVPASSADTRKGHSVTAL